MKATVKFSKWCNSKGEIIFCTMYDETDNWSVYIKNSENYEIQLFGFVLKSSIINSGDGVEEATKEEFIDTYNKVNNDITRKVMINL